jgi:hypothetical protein
MEPVNLLIFVLVFIFFIVSPTVWIALGFSKSSPGSDKAYLAFSIIIEVLTVLLTVLFMISPKPGILPKILVFLFAMTMFLLIAIIAIAKSKGVDENTINKLRVARTILHGISVSAIIVTGANFIKEMSVTEYVTPANVQLPNLGELQPAAPVGPQQVQVRVNHPNGSVNIGLEQPTRAQALMQQAQA